MTDQKEEPQFPNIEDAYLTGFMVAWQMRKELGDDGVEAEKLAEKNFQLWLNMFFSQYQEPREPADIEEMTDEVSILEMVLKLRDTLKMYGALPLDPAADEADRELEEYLRQRTRDEPKRVRLGVSSEEDLLDLMRAQVGENPPQINVPSSEDKRLDRLRDRVAVEIKKRVDGDVETFAEIIREVIQVKTPNEVGDALGVSKPTVLRWADGSHYPHPVLQVQVYKLLLGMLHV